MWGWEDFASLLLEAANGSLLYIGAGVAAGVVIFAVVLGIRKGLSALRTASGDAGAFDGWEVSGGKDQFGNEYCSCGYVLDSSACRSIH